MAPCQPWKMVPAISVTGASLFRCSALHRSRVLNKVQSTSTAAVSQKRLLSITPTPDAAPDEELTKESISQFEDGTHAWLRNPLCTSTDSSFKMTDYRAPHTGFIRVLSLNELASSNALSINMVSNLESHIDDLTSPNAFIQDLGANVRALVLTSEHPKTFCAGANLKERAKMSTEEVRHFLTNLRRTFQKFSDAPFPIIAGVHGFALGGGLELALSSHIRVCSSTATLGLPEVRLGIIPGAGGTFLLPQIIGHARAMEMIVSGRRITGTQAEQIGLCTEVVDGGKDEVQRACLKIAARIALGGPQAVRFAMQAVRGGMQEAEDEQYERCLETEDRMEALNAFREKRTPKFQGK